MSLIKAENLTFAYPGTYDNIFENVSFQIDTDWKLGFIGRNGRGKTTFLNLLLRKYSYEGKIISSVKFDYFPYEVADKSLITEDILSEICPVVGDWEIIRELSYLDVNAEALYRPFETLSNGEQTKVLLAALFLNEGNFLLIDEPTNHLDAKARQIVSAYLKKKKGFILVSHDRAFLDGCVNHILAINRKNIEVQSGNFSSWFENFERQQEFEKRKNEHLERDIDKLRQAALRAAVWSDKSESKKIGFNPTKEEKSISRRSYEGKKSKKMMKRSKTIEARRECAIAEKSELLQNIESYENLKLSPLQFYTNRIATLTDVSVSYDNVEICSPVSFTISVGERIVLDGKNGSGKSSILKVLLGELTDHTGTVSVASRTVISYIPQDTSHLHGSLSNYAEKYNIDESLFKAILRKLGFERIQFEKNMEDFSEGQKKKTLIARSLCEKAHLYIWDEPLNFIDIYSRMQIEKLLLTYTPTIIFVEHDKNFRERIATKTIHM